MPAQTVLEELTADDLTRDHVNRRADDWSSRIHALYELVGSWLPDGWTARRGKPVPMHEELMRSTGVPARELPTLELVHDGRVAATIRPYGLWIIGNNGRLDFVKGGAMYRIVDHAKTFEAPDWRIVSSASRESVSPFDRERLEALLGS